MKPFSWVSPCIPQGSWALDRDKLAQYAEYYREVGGYPYDRDPHRPDWFPLVPNTRWADPSISAVSSEG